MSDAIIKVQNLGKRYRIRHQQSGMNYVALRDVLAQKLKTAVNPFPRKSRPPSPAREDFWALQDVNFEVRPGEKVGLIGRNGAGKSTVLKLLSRITEPTRGRIEINGRVASLLEVGTGFHPELTGRENIFLNGAILGMGRQEIKRNFDEIVAFSEVEKFLDTPVKRYSSGMYVRLAFAVAAHLEPEILLVDEVLAVGDAQFQKKCLGKMDEVSKKQGRTIIFVSHNMATIVSFCQRGLLLKDGRIEADGDISQVVSHYLQESTRQDGQFRKEASNGQTKLEIEKIGLYKGGKISTLFSPEDTLAVRIDYQVRRRISGAQVAIEVFNELSECIFSSTDQDWSGEKPEVLPGRQAVECPIDLGFFKPGKYSIKVSSSVPNLEILDLVEDQLAFEVYDDHSPVLKLGQARKGIILPKIRWNKVS